MRLFKIIATSLNLALLVFFLYLLSYSSFSGFAKEELGELIVVLSIINIFAIWVKSESDNWLQLFLKRKALEEKKKIEALNDKQTGSKV